MYSQKDFIEMSSGRDWNNKSKDRPHVKFGRNEMIKFGVDTRIKTRSGVVRSLDQFKVDYDTTCPASLGTPDGTVTWLFYRVRYLFSQNITPPRDERVKKGKESRVQVQAYASTQKTSTGMKQVGGDTIFHKVVSSVHVVVTLCACCRLRMYTVSDIVDRIS